MRQRGAERQLVVMVEVEEEEKDEAEAVGRRLGEGRDATTRTAGVVGRLEQVEVDAAIDVSVLIWEEIDSVAVAGVLVGVTTKRWTGMVGEDAWRCCWRVGWERMRKIEMVGP